MKSRLVASLLLLVHRYLLIKLQKQLFRVVQDALTLFVLLIAVILLSSLCYLGQLVIIIVTVKQLLHTIPSEVLGVLLKLRIL